MREALWHRLIGVLFVVVLLALPAAGRAAEVIPPKPAGYFNDYAAVVSRATAKELDTQLEKFEDDTTNQIWVVVYPKMQSDSSIEDYTVRVARAWGVGQKSKNNGTVLFVFIQDRKAFIQVGYGLEGALPDATCKRIIDEALEPAFKTGNYEGGLRAGIAGILTATKDEYAATGPSDGSQSFLSALPCLVVSLGGFVLLGILLFVIHCFGGTFYQRHMRTLSFAENGYLFLLNIGLSMLFSGGSSRSSSGGGGGGSSSGGGSFGGGGAGGSW